MGLLIKAQVRAGDTARKMDVPVTVAVSLRCTLGGQRFMVGLCTRSPSRGRWHQPLMS